jgi:phosphate-selective porin OprO/OprP
MRTENQFKGLTVTVVGTFFAIALVLRAEPGDGQEELRAQIRELDHQLRALERKLELQEEQKAEKKANTPLITAGVDGFRVQSVDTNFMLSVHGHLQVDSRTSLHDGGVKGNNGFLLRRARPILQGTIFRDFDFLLVPDFGGSTVQIVDAYLNYRYRPELQMQAGKFKSPVGLEHLQADISTLFNERSLATDLVPYRDVGVELHGELLGGTINYAAGILNGTPDYTTATANADYDDNKAFAGRLFFQPFKQTARAALRGLGLGVGGSYEVDRAWTNTASTGLTPGYTTDGQQKFFTYNNGVVGNGTHWRISPQGYYYYGPFGLLGEYTISDQRVINLPKHQSTHLQHTAWELTGSWVLTGEEASYTGVTPRHSFDPLNGGWGALQVVSRYAELNVDDAAFPSFADPATSASAAQAWVVGLNWYLSRGVRFNTSFSRTTFRGSGAAKFTATKAPENVLFTRLQLAF